MIEAGVGGQAATQVIQGERLFDLVVRMKPSTAPARGRSAICWCPRRPGSRCRSPSWPTFTRATARHSSTAKIIRATSACSSASKGATWRARWAMRRRRCASPSTLPQGYTPGLGRRIQRIRRGARAICHHRAAGDPADLHDSFRAVRKFQIPGHRDDRRGDDRAGGRADRAETNAHAVQRQFRAGPAGA